MRAVTLLLALGALGLSVSPSEACRAIGGSGSVGTVASSSLSLRNGTSCFIRNFSNINDAVGARRVPSTNMSITGQGTLGSASVSGNRIVYAAKRGAIGSGQFTYRVHFKNGKHNDFRVSVTVY